MLFQHAFNGMEPLEDAFRVVETVNADSQLVRRWNTKPPKHVFAALADWGPMLTLRIGPLDRDGIALDKCVGARERNGRMLMLDPRFR
jgi:hypothetical protein